MWSRRRLLLSALSFLIVVCGVNGMVGAHVFNEDGGVQLAQERILPIYDRLPKPTDETAQKVPWLMEVTIKDVWKVDGCSGWIVRVWAPTSRQPPYLNDNHHSEHWGVLEDAEYLLGRGRGMEASQDIEVGALADFLAHACRPMPDENVIARTFLQLILAGRFRFAMADTEELPKWMWIDDANEVPTQWRSEVQEIGAIPPRVAVKRRGSEYRACALAKVGDEHVDVGCWRFRFSRNRRLLDVEEVFRRESSPLVP